MNIFPSRECNSHGSLNKCGTQPAETEKEGGGGGDGDGKMGKRK